jgi:hypothetical protein
VPAPPESPSPRAISIREATLWAAATALFVVAVAFDWPDLLRGPAPYPPEWQWLLRDEAVSRRFGPVAATLAVLLALVIASGRRWSDPRRAGRVLLAAGTGAGAGFSLALLGLEPAGALETVYGRVVYRTATSYYTVAVSAEAEDPLDFVRRHHELLPAFRKAAKHAATHPPGPVLYYRAWLGLFESSPGLTRGVLALADIPDANPRRPRPQHAPAARAAALAGGLGMIVLGALTAWPIRSLASALGAGPLAAARAGLLWLVLPGPVLFAPYLDQALALPVAASAAALTLALSVGEVAAESRRAARHALLAGLWGGIATFLSYGAPAFLAIGGLAAGGLGLVGGRRRRTVAARLALAAAAAAFVFVLPALAGHRPFASATTALAIHREFFTAPREYAAWLVFDPLDLAIFLGVPLALALVVRTLRSLRAGAAGMSASAGDGFRLGAVLGLVLLIVSGQTRGEVGRIWIPIMPVLLAAAIARPGRAEGDGPTAVEATVLALLLAVCAVALRVYWKLA